MSWYVDPFDINKIVVGAHECLTKKITRKHLLYKNEMWSMWRRCHNKTTVERHKEKWKSWKTVDEYLGRNHSIDCSRIVDGTKNERIDDDANRETGNRFALVILNDAFWYVSLNFIFIVIDAIHKFSTKKQQTESIDRTSIVRLNWINVCHLTGRTICSLFCSRSHSLHLLTSLCLEIRYSMFRATFICFNNFSYWPFHDSMKTDSLDSAG